MDDQQVDQILGSAEQMLQEISQSPVPGQQQDIRPIVAQEVQKALAQFAQNLPIMQGPPGPKGEDGKSIEPSEVIQFVKKEVAKIPKPKDGKDGKDGKLREIRTQIRVPENRASAVEFSPHGNLSSTNIQDALAEEVDDLAASTGSSLVGFVQSGIGASARDLQSHVRDLVVNAKGFGSKFATTPAADVNLAITAVNAAGGGTVLIPESFTAETSVVMKSNVTLRGLGRGTILTTASDAAVISGTSVSNVTVRDLYIQGDDDALKTSQRGVQFISVTDSLVHNVYVKNTGHDGILLLSGCVGNTVSDCHVDGCNDDGINIGGDNSTATTDNTVTGCVAENVTNDGIHVSDGSLRTTVTGNVVIACGNGIGLFKTNKATLTGNTIYNCTNYGIHTPSGPCADIAIVGNVIDTCARGIFTNNTTTRMAITGNVIRDCTAYGIAFSETATFDIDTTVTGNHISGGVTTAGLLISGVQNVVATGNQFIDLTGDGVVVTGSSTQITITGNNFRDIGDEGIEVVAADANNHITITNNSFEQITGRCLEYRGGAYFNVSDNRCIASSDFTLLLSHGSGLDGYGVVERNIVIGGGSSEGIRVGGYNHVLVRDNVVTGISGGTGINITSGSQVIVEGNKSDKTISGGMQLARVFASVGNSGTGEDDLMTTTLAAGYLAKNGDGLRITAWGIKANTANAKTLKLYFGTTAILTHSLGTSAAGTWRIEAEVIRTGASAQRYNAVLTGTDTDAETATTMTETDTATIVVKCTGEATSNNDIVQTGMIVERLGD